MSIENKMFAFDYLVNGIKNWYIDTGGDFAHNDLSKLKITKLIFFICASTTSKDEPGLLNTFDNFVAMPYGHVESDIQDYMATSQYFVISKDGLADKEGAGEYLINQNIQDLQPLLDMGLDKLKHINNKLVTYLPFTLVDISHQWQSWKTVFSLARSYGKNSMKIPDQMIMVEPKIFV